MAFKDKYWSYQKPIAHIYIMKLLALLDNQIHAVFQT